MVNRMLKELWTKVINTEPRKISKIDIVLNACNENEIMRCVVCVFKIARQRSEELKRKNQDYLSAWLFLSEREIRVNDSTHAGSSSFKQSDMCKKKGFHSLD